MIKNPLYLLCALLIMIAAACGKNEPPAPAPPPEPAPAAAPAPAGVTGGAISLGKAVGPDKKISAPADTFAKADTIYASVETSGSGTAVLKAKWTYSKGGQSTDVKDDSQTIMPTGPATSEFHISKPGGWPTGDYQVEVFVDDKSIGTKSFTVK
jgi:hypothetical protein